jgi:uncharacterized protein YacL
MMNAIEQEYKEKRERLDKRFRRDTQAAILAGATSLVFALPLGVLLKSAGVSVSFGSLGHIVFIGFGFGLYALTYATLMFLTAARRREDEPSE